MLDSAVKNAQIENLLDEIISVERCKVYKPNSEVYKLVTDVFEVKKEEKNPDILYIDLRPMFEKHISFSKIDSISKDTRGIYRYLNEDGDVIYIGKGIIKNRAKSVERKNWDIKQIQYSELYDEDKMLEWEAFYIKQFVKEKGYKPKYNSLMGNKIK